MTQDEKDLLLKDLCSRLPYKVKCEVYDRVGTLIEISEYGFAVTYDNGAEETTCKINNIKPYLFPMSSMTEEEKKEYRKACELDTEILSKCPMDEAHFLRCITLRIGLMLIILIIDVSSQRD